MPVTNTKKVVEITYNNSVIATVEVGQTAVIQCANKKLVSDLKFNIKEVEDTNLITFTIGSAEYQAEEGMTWRQWVESSYNTGGFYVSGSEIYKDNTHYISKVNADDKITPNKNYELLTGGGSND